MVPELRIIDQELWNSVKARQAGHNKVRSSKTATDKNGLSVAQSLRRRKYLLSGLMSGGQCGGNLTVAGSGKARRYYCANAKEKGPSVCTGMRGLKEQDAAVTILSGLKTGLMRDEAYAEFRKAVLARVKSQGEERDRMLQLHNQNVRQLETCHANLLKAVENGDYSAPIVAQLNKVDTELTEALAKREAIIPEPLPLPADLPALYRNHIDNLVETLSDEGVAGRASDELHQLIDAVVVSWNAEAKVHELELSGKLLEMLNIRKPAGEAGLTELESSLKLVAGKTVCPFGRLK